MPGPLIEESIVIDAPPHEVWSVIDAVEDYPIWNPLIRSLRGPIEVGARLRVRLALFPGRFGFPIRPRVTAFEPGRELRWIGWLLATWVFAGEHSFRIRRLDDRRTQFVQVEEYQGILTRPILLVFGPQFRRGFSAMNRALRARVHARPSD